MCPRHIGGSNPIDTQMATDFCRMGLGKNGRTFVICYRKVGSWTFNLIPLPCNDRYMTKANYWNVLDHRDAVFVGLILLLMIILELWMKIMNFVKI